MATLTEKIVITWATADDQHNTSLYEPRLAKLQAMITAGQTDDVPVIISPTETQRNFIDIASAQEYGDWLVSECTVLGITNPTFIVSPL